MKNVTEMVDNNMTKEGLVKGNYFEESEDIDIVKIEPQVNTMSLEVLRYSTNEDSTLGMLFDTSNKRKFLCYTLEDEKREVKLRYETRIPAGEYEISFRTEGGFHARYLSRYGKEFHKGMLQILDVPDFEYILIHCGNTEKDTAGCLLVGDTSIQNITKLAFIGSSVEAYKRIYLPIAHHLDTGGIVKITYIDYDG
tara:strand:- start:67 stop:654 length:588 start_codon:yes stop_codon:yes gene_type:complete